ncbi:MAG: hypothetical protein WC889_18780 [Myxococcota bacterium]|jgi:hypothetical protein
MDACRDNDSFSKAGLGWPGAVVVFVLALLCIHMMAGVSPILWVDTPPEQGSVRWCLEKGECALFGPPTAFGDLVQGGAWNALRVFLSILGLGMNGVHQALQVMDALGVVLVALSASMLLGRTAGLASAAVTLLLLLPDGIRVEALTNSRLMFFPGAVCTALMVQAAVMRDPARLLLAALTAAIAFNSHMACAPLLISSVIVAPFAFRRRYAGAVLVAVVAVGASFLISPGLWSYYALAAVRGALMRGSAAGWNGFLSVAYPLFWTVIAAAPLLLFRLWPGPEGKRRAAQVVAAVVLPGLLVFMFMRGFTDVSRSTKYLTYLIPAMSLAVVTLIALARPVCWRISVAVVCLVLLASGAMDTIRIRTGGGLAGAINYDDAGFVRRSLGGRGWSVGDIYSRLTGPRGYDLVAAISADSAIDGWTQAAQRPAGPVQAAAVFKVPVAALPEKLPETWIVRRSGREALVVALHHQWLDTLTFEVCGGGRDGSGCTPGGLVPREPGILQEMVYPGALMVDGGGPVRDLSVRFNVRTGGGREFVVAFPDTAGGCAGTVTAVENGGAVFSDGGRRALVTLDGGGYPATVTIRWRPFSDECREWRSFLPFFIAASPDEADLLGRLAGKGGGT